MWNVYILKSLNKSWYYVGSTNDVERRINEHNSGKVQSTKAFRPLEIVWTKKFESESDCRKHEKTLKSKRIEKERIIRDLSK